MAKKVWISLPLTTASEANDPAVVSFLKGGLKKELEAETATFITKWMADKSVPFHIDIERSSLERNRVMVPASQGSQSAPDGVSAPSAAESDKVVETEHSADAAVEQVVEDTPIVPEPADERAEAVPDGPDSHVDASGGVGLRRARGKAGRRVLEASKAEG